MRNKYILYLFLLKNVLSLFKDITIKGRKITNYSADFKSKSVLEILKNERTLEDGLLVTKVLEFKKTNKLLIKN